MTPTQLKKVISNRTKLREEAFGVLKELARLVAAGSDRAQDLVLRLLQNRDCVEQYSEILDSIVAQVGLYPYVAPETVGELAVHEQIAYEFNRPFGLEAEGLIFHQEQGRVYRELMSGRSVMLSAPTSFGKSLIIDAMVASDRFQNIVVVVPTIALIDETRRRLARTARGYKVISHPGAQDPAQRNVFVLTQERVLQSELPTIDFFVIDEFYKLTPRQEDTNRSLLLNQAFYRLAKQAKQFYMLGPNIRGVPDGFPERFECTFVSTEYMTVSSDVHRVTKGDSALD